MPCLTMPPTAVSGCPYLYVGDDDTVWLDPRHFLGPTRLYSRNILATEFMKSCSLVDDEILLVHGELCCEHWRRARPERDDRSFHPGQKIVEIATGAPHSLKFDVVDERFPAWATPPDPWILG